jgi:hypothetical protein
VAIGVGLIGEDDEPESIMAMADAAMYLRKDAA